MRIFVSSPLTGLKEVRRGILEGADQLGVQFTSMESFLSSPNIPKEECLEHLRECNAVILIVGPYYGSIDPETGKSFTEIEFDEAKKLGIPLFPFVFSSEVSEWKPEDQDKQTQEKHQVFFNKVQSSAGYIHAFDKPEEVVEKIEKSIKQHQDRLLKPYHPLLGYQDYFYTFINKDNADQLFRHDYQLVGRNDEINSIDRFIESDKRILPIIGRGGIGKSKVLYEVARKYSSAKSSWSRFLFIKENINFDDSVLKQIPPGNSVLVLEDAHRYDQLLKVFAIFRNRDLLDRIKLIITSRPSGEELLDMNLSISIDQSFVDEKIRLNDLSLKDTETLIRQFVKNDDGLVSYIKNLTKDSPLAAIIGSRLVAEKKLEPAKIATDNEFIRRVLDRFLEDFKVRISTDAYLDDLLKYVAALGPIKSGDKAFISTLSKVLEVKESKIISKLDELENCGLLIRRGRLLRITPDLLSDHILYKACISNQGPTTGFPTEVYAEFSDNYATHLLANVSEIEWRAKLDGIEVNLLSDIWEDIYTQFREAINYDRVEILKKIEKASFFQPKETMKLIQIALNEPTTKKPTGELAEVMSALREWTQDDVLRQVPNILKNVSYHLDHLKLCCQILWDLGKDDRRELNPNPDHSIRVLQDIVGYNNPRQPVAFKEKIVGFLEELNRDPTVHDFKYSICDVISEILKKEGEYTTSDAHAFTFHPYMLNVKALLPIRKRVIDILESHLYVEDKSYVISRAFETLRSALQYAHGSFGRAITDEEEKQWLPEQINILQVIQRSLSQNSHRAYHVFIKKELRWFEQHGRHSELKNLVKEIRDSICEDYSFRIYQALFGDFIDFWDDERDYKEQQRIKGEELQKLAEEVLKVEGDALAIFNILNAAIGELKDYRCDPKPNHLISFIVEQNPTMGIDLYKLMLRDPNCPLASYSHSLLWPLRRVDGYESEFSEIVEEGIKSENRNIIHNIAHTYAWGGFLDNIKDFDMQYLIQLAQIKDETMLSTFVSAITNLGKYKPAEAKNILITIDVSANLADAIFSCINDQYGIPFEVFSEEDFKLILDKMVELHIFRGQHYHVDQLLKAISEKYPDLVIEFLIKRLDYSHRSDVRAREYAPMPYLGFDVKLFDNVKIKDPQRFIKEIRDLSVKSAGRDSFWLPKLFETVSQKYSDQSLEVLSEWINSKEEEKLVAASMLLKEAEDGFLFSKHNFIAIILEKAAAVSEDCLSSVRSNLFSISISGGWTRSHGKPSEKHLKQKKLGPEYADKYSATHPANKFFNDIAKHADDTIRQELARDEELEYE